MLPMPIITNLKVNNTGAYNVGIGRTTTGVTCNDFTIYNPTATAATGQVSLEQTFYVAGNLTIGTGCKFTATDVTAASPVDYGIVLKGNWTNNGTFSPGSSRGIAGLLSWLLFGTYIVGNSEVILNGTERTNPLVAVILLPL